jgi:hypothetical protein
MEFSIKRVFLLFKRLFAIHKIGLIASVFVVFLMGITYHLFDIDNFLLFYFISIVGIIFAHNDYTLNKERSPIFDLTFPASCLEKYITSLLFIFVVWNACLLFGIFLSIPVSNLLIGNPINLLQSWEKFVALLSPQNWLLIDHFSVLFLLSLAYACSVFFKKNSYFKFLIIGFAFVGLNVLNMVLFDCNPDMMYDFIYEDEAFLDYFNTMSEIMHQYMPILLTIASIFLFVVTYFRLKEERV